MTTKVCVNQPGFAVENLDVLSVSRKKGHSFTCREGRLKHGFLYTASGGICSRFFHSDMGSIQTQPGDLIFIPKGCAYTATYSQDNTEIKIIQFDLSRGELDAYLAAPGRIELPNAGELIQAFFSRQDAHPLFLLSCFYSLLWQISEYCLPTPQKYKKLQPALRELSRHCDADWKISHYADLCDMGESTFRRLFREYTGQSPVDFRNSVRLEQARARLLSGAYNVSEAAELSGFTNLSFFIRLYKDRYGHTPGNAR